MTAAAIATARSAEAITAVRVTAITTIPMPFLRRHGLRQLLRLWRAALCRLALGPRQLRSADPRDLPWRGRTLVSDSRNVDVWFPIAEALLGW
jgi:hypothetical protein